MFKFIIYPSCERALNNGKVKSKIFRKSSSNFFFGKSSYPKSDIARSSSKKAVLFQISLRLNMGIFSNNFAFCVAGFLGLVTSSFCSMPWLAGWFLLRKIIEQISVFYPVCLKKYLKKLDKHLWRDLFSVSCTITHQSLLAVNQTLC